MAMEKQVSGLLIFLNSSDTKTQMLKSESKKNSVHFATGKYQNHHRCRQIIGKTDGTRKRR